MNVSAIVNPAPAVVEQQTEQFESALGRTLALHLHYVAWNGLTGGALGAPDFQGDASAGRVPVISWVCGDNLTTIATQVNAKSGSDYATVQNAAQAIAAYGKPVFIRFFWEFNLDLHGEGTNGNATNCFTAGTANAQKATEFINAWEAIVTTFRDAGATNVAWVWNPAGAPADLANLPSLANFLPPSSFVSWIGVDAYDKLNQGFDATFAPFYRAFGSLGFPLMIGETGELRTSSAPCTQAQYFSDALTSLSAQGAASSCAAATATTFPGIKAFSYFDAAPNPNFDWTVAPGTPGFTNLSSLANSAYFSVTP